MTLQTSPVLSTLHFILLPAGRCSCATPDAGNNKKSCGPCFPRKESNHSGGNARSHSHPERVSLKIQQGYLQRDWGLFHVICEDQLRGLMSAWAGGNPTGCLLYSFLTVCVFVCDRAPRCCSDVSSLCPHSRTVTPCTYGPLRREPGARASVSFSLFPTPSSLWIFQLAFPLNCWVAQVIGRATKNGTKVIPPISSSLSNQHNSIYVKETHFSGIKT